MAGLPHLEFPMEEEKWGQHKTDSRTGESIGLESILKNLWMGMIIPDCCYVITAAPVAYAELWNDEKIGLQPPFGHALDGALYILEKDTPATALAVGHNPKDIFQNRWQHPQSILCCPLQLVPSLKLPTSNIPKKCVICCTCSITQHVKTDNVWMKTDQNTTVWWHGTESRNYNAESANKASKCNEARKEPWATLLQCHHKTFLHQNLVWSSLETLTRAGIVSPHTSQHSFHASNTDCHHPKCCSHIESRSVSW